jgi:hypothetical protein
LKDAFASNQMFLIDGHGWTDRVAMLVHADTRAANALNGLVVAVRCAKELRTDRFVHGNVIKSQSAFWEKKTVKFKLF